MKNLLIIGFVWPEPNSTAAGTRMLQLIDVFQKDGYTITFASTASKSNNSFPLERIDIQTTNIQLNNESFDKFVKKLNPTIVLFDRYLTEEQFGWRVADVCPNALRILDTEDLHFLRYARQIALKNNAEVSLNLLNNDIAKREIASIYRCDLTLIISKYEMKLLKKQVKIDKKLLHYVPFLVENIPEKFLKNLPSFNKRSHFISIGNFKHEPNWNAVLYLKSTIWPMIKKQLPEAELHIYGAYTTEKVLQLNNIKEGFLIKGWAKNTSAIFKNAKICLAPLLFGAGLKGKLLDAMQYGTPSITTTIGAEGMHNSFEWNGFITNNPEEFAEKAVVLYQNQEIWENAQRNGQIILNKCFSKEKYRKKLLRKIAKLEVNKEQHRLKNFTGSLLMHHSLQSTKYLSKWIEEKNKKA
jgi:glycosyltransferase involved in cell wall biosynthesis